MAVPLRFAGLVRLYGEAAWQKIAQAHCAVLGLGGVGSWAAEALVRSGLGQITLFDLDDVCVSNINRQLHALDTSVGRSKVAVMAERLLDINPDLKIGIKSQFVTIINLEASLAPAGQKPFDVVIDAIDQAAVKVGLIVWCRNHQQKLVVVGGAGGKRDPRFILSGDLSRTTQDPLLAKVRYQLRRHHGWSRDPKKRLGVECIYSTEPLIYPQADGRLGFNKPGGFAGGTALDCAGALGAASFVTGSFGFLAAQRALSALLDTSPAAKNHPCNTCR